MENFNYNNNKSHQKKLQNSSELSLTLRKKKLNQKLNENHFINEPDVLNYQEESENMSKLCVFSKTLLEQKETENITIIQNL